MAMWAMLASPLMIGADVRSMAPEYRAVWLNKELVRVSQDPLGLQGQRIRGNASECQVWLRHLDNGGELYVVLFNNGKGSCDTADVSTYRNHPADVLKRGHCCQTQTDK